MDISIVIGWVGFIASLFVGPAQLLKTLKTKNVEGISIVTYWFLLLTCTAYLIRAAVIKEWIFIVSNLFGVIVTIAMLILFYIYGEKQ